MSSTPLPTFSVEVSELPSPCERAFTPVFDGLWGEGTITQAAARPAYCVPASPACATTLPQRSFSVAMNFGNSANGGLTTGTTPVRLTAC